MELLIVCAAALVASGLTLFSGFGLGTLLMPVFALFVPLELAVAMTAVVHLANNLFKVGLLGRRADWVWCCVSACPRWRPLSWARSGSFRWAVRSRWQSTRPWAGTVPLP